MRTPGVSARRPRPPARAAAVSDRAVIAGVLGALVIAFSAILVDLADVTPATAAVWRCAYALPVLGLMAWCEHRRYGPRSARERRLAAAAGVLFAVDIMVWHYAIARRRRRPGDRARQPPGGDRAVPGARRARRAGRRARILVALPPVCVGVCSSPARSSDGAYGANPARGALLGIADRPRLRRVPARPAPGLDGPAPPGGRAVRDVARGRGRSRWSFGLAIGVDDLAPAWPSAGWLITLALTSQVVGWLLITVSLPRLPAAMTSMILTIQPIALGRARRRSCSARSRRSLQLCGVAFILAGVISVAVRRRAACAHCWLTAAASSSTAGSRRRWRSSAPTSTIRSWTARILRDQPELVLAAHRAFVDAGAEIVISASYQAPDDLLAESVRIARAGRGARRGVASRPTARRWRAGRSTPATTRSRRAGTSGALRCCSRPSPTSWRSRRSRARTRRPRSSALGSHGLDCWVTVHLPRRRAHRATASASRTPCAASLSPAGRRGRRQLHRAGARRRAAAPHPLGHRPAARRLPERRPRLRPADRRRGAARRRPGAATPRSCGGCCGVGRYGESRGASPGAVRAAGEHLAVVQAVRAALPELDRVGSRRKPPQCGGRGTSSGYCASTLGQARLEPLAVRDHLGLPRRPGAELGAARAGREVGVGLLGRRAPRPGPRAAPGAAAASTGPRAPRAGSRSARGPCGSRSW